MSLATLDRALHEVTFVVVDLETTGGSPTAGATITEIGAVKVCGGVVVDEFQQMVNPDSPIPPFISALTGIDDLLVADEPILEQVLPDFLGFAAGSVLVAHNAPFDIGFLRHFARAHGLSWQFETVIDTVKLARRTLDRSETLNLKLGTLAAYVGSTTRPEHRALGDARATVDVLHAMLDRLGNRGVTTLDALVRHIS